jgi:hypothetical protein
MNSSFGGGGELLVFHFFWLGDGLDEGMERLSKGRCVTTRRFYNKSRRAHVSGLSHLPVLAVYIRMIVLYVRKESLMEAGQ